VLGRADDDRRSEVGSNTWEIGGRGTMRIKRMDARRYRARPACEPEAKERDVREGNERTSHAPSSSRWRKRWWLLEGEHRWWRQKKEVRKTDDLFDNLDCDLATWLAGPKL